MDLPGGAPVVSEHRDGLRAQAEFRLLVDERVAVPAGRKDLGLDGAPILELDIGSVGEHCR